jgi:hypothetical protein|tara:strand:- start:2557 stop:2838 length:282 start_codon:yes stop_codon:yes gene_type:complete
MSASAVMSKRDRWVRKFVRAANDPLSPVDGWAGYPISDLPDGTWVDTGSWLGWVEVSFATNSEGWVYILNFNSWAFTNVSSPQANGYWFYLQR